MSEETGEIASVGIEAMTSAQIDNELRHGISRANASQPSNLIRLLRR